MALLLAAVSLATGGCKRSRPPAAPPPPPIPALGPVTIADVTPEEARPAGTKLDVTALEVEARRLLEAGGVFAAGKGDAGAAVVARVRMELAMEDVVEADKGAARAMIRLRIDTRPSEVAARRFNEDVQAGSETIYKAAAVARPGAQAAAPSAPGPDRQAIFTRLVTRTIQDLLSAYVARQQLWTGDATKVRRAMTADAGELKMEAIRAVGERKLTSEAPALLKLLQHEDEAVRDAALGALVELRDRRAVSVLAEQRSMRDQREMRKILDAISVLGGPEAADYLGFVAGGHEDAEIRTMATEARNRMLRREGKPVPPASGAKPAEQPR
jgi:HEAT repeat protein